jgi:hypothetical protein
VPGDCLIDMCLAGHCYGTQCEDQVRDGDETDVDCGGGMCPRCPVGRMCKGASDCITDFCLGGMCL